MMGMMISRSSLTMLAAMTGMMLVAACNAVVATAPDVRQVDTVYVNVYTDTTIMMCDCQGSGVQYQGGINLH